MCACVRLPIEGQSSIWSWNFHLFYSFHYLNISFQNDTVKPKF